MNIKHSLKNNELTVIPEGRLDSSTSDEFSVFLEDNITDGVSRLVLDMLSVDFISSKGLRVLVSTYKKLNGREFAIRNANSSVMEVIRLSGLLNLFRIL